MDDRILQCANNLDDAISVFREKYLGEYKILSMYPTELIDCRGITRTHDDTASTILDIVDMDDETNFLKSILNIYDTGIGTKVMEVPCAIYNIGKLLDLLADTKNLDAAIAYFESEDANSPFFYLRSMEGSIPSVSRDVYLIYQTMDEINSSLPTKIDISTLYELHEKFIEETNKCRRLSRDYRKRLNTFKSKFSLRFKKNGCQDKIMNKTVFHLRTILDRAITRIKEVAVWCENVADDIEMPHLKAIYSAAKCVEDEAGKDVIEAYKNLQYAVYGDKIPF